MPTSDLVASFRGSSLASDGELEPYLERTTCLANLQHQPKKLHSMYPYDDFFDRGDLSEGDEDSLGSSSPRLAELMESPEARDWLASRLCHQVQIFFKGLMTRNETPVYFAV